MFKRVLAAYDGSDTARTALTVAVLLAKRSGAEVSTVSVEEHLPRYAASVGEVQGAKERIDEYFHTLTKQARDSAALEGVALDTLVRRGHEVAEILSEAREGRFDLLVIGAHGHSRVFERVIGSTSLSVARLAPCSVLIVRTTRGSAVGAVSPKRILVGVDGSPLGRLAVRTALDLASLFGAAVIGMTVREVSPLARSERGDWPYGQQLLAAAEEHARTAGVAFEHVIWSGHASQALRQQAKDGQADLIVLGATGLEHPWSPTIGGTASSVASEAPCSILLVRPPQAVLHAEDVMMRAVSSVTIDAPLTEVVELLIRRNVKALPVLDARRHVVGIVTGGDLISRGQLDLRLSLKGELDAETLRERLGALARSLKTAREVMTRHVHTVGTDADLVAVIQLMAARRVKRLPVVNQSRELVGIVSRADVLRAIAALPEGAEEADRELPTMGRTVADAVMVDVPTVAPEAPADEVLAEVLENPLRRVVVVRPDRTAVGLISDRDLLARSSPDTRPWLMRMLVGPRSPQPCPLGPRRTAAEGEPLTAADLMAPLLLSVRPSDSLARAVRLMMQHQVKRLVVVDDDGKFRGLVDRREVLRLLAGER